MNNVPAVYFIGVRITCRSGLPFHQRGTNSNLWLPCLYMAACSNWSANLQLLMKSLGTGFSNPSQETTLAEQDVKESDVSLMKELLKIEVLLKSSVGRVLL